MIKLSTNLSNHLVELLSEEPTLIDALEVGSWLSPEQIVLQRLKMSRYLFYFHAGNLVNLVGVVPGATALVNSYLRATESPWVSLHITTWLPGMVWLIMKKGWHIPLPNPKQVTKRYIRQVNRITRSTRVPVLLENMEPLPLDGYDFESRTDLIQEVINATGCGFLLDIAHARVSASVLNLDIYDYLNRLPLDKVMQIHISGPRLQNGRLVDAHDTLQQIDYELLEYVFTKTHPSVVTLEYIRERDDLRDQLTQLRKIIGTPYLTNRSNALPVAP
jgi:uncharacterized protein